MEYEDDDYASYTSSADISIPILQEARFELSTPDIMPAAIEPGAEADVMFSIYNLGKVPLYNVKVAFEGDSVSGGETFIGKIEAGGTGNVDVMVTGEKGAQNAAKPKVVISYEDEAGNREEYKEEIELEVLDAGEMDDAAGKEIYEFNYDDYDFEDEDFDEDGSKKIIVIICIAAAVLVLIIAAALLLSGRRRKKERLEEMELLDDLPDDIRDIKIDAKNDESDTHDITEEKDEEH